LNAGGGIGGSASVNQALKEPDGVANRGLFQIRLAFK
jgi:hypothetical protein